ncbi:MAG: hypothetical protein OHK0039_41170 [Bacteroidia bacterium]
MQSWELYHHAKAARDAGDFAVVFDCLRQVAALPAPERLDPRLGNAFGWLIYACGKQCLPPQPQWGIAPRPSDRNPDLPAAMQVHQLLAWAQCLHYDWQQAPNPYGLLLRLALKARKQYPHFLGFVDWWNLDRLGFDDYRPFTPPGGEPIPALAEQAYMGVAKHLLDGYGPAGLLPDGQIDRPAIEAFLPRLAGVIAAYPAFVYLPYLRAQLWLALDRPAEALADLLPFTRGQIHQFWAWDWLGRTYYRLGRTEAARACFARALTERAPAEMVVLTRERYARLCRDTGLDAEARAAFESVIRTRRQHWARVPQRLADIEASDWYRDTPPATPAEAMVQQLARGARDLLYEDLPEELAVVTAVRADKDMAWYRLDRNRSGNLRLHELGETLQPGDALRLRVQARPGRQEVWHQVLTARRSQEPPPAALARSFYGRLDRRPDQDFAFVDRTYFVPAPLCQSLANGTRVQGLAVQDYDRKRARWGWSVVRLAAIE